VRVEGEHDGHSVVGARVGINDDFARSSERRWQERRMKQHKANDEPTEEEHCVKPAISERHVHPDGK
jgi:hypothetical protein